MSTMELVGRKKIIRPTCEVLFIYVANYVRFEFLLNIYFLNHNLTIVLGYNNTWVPRRLCPSKTITKTMTIEC